MYMNGKKIVMWLETDVGSELPLTFNVTHPGLATVKADMFLTTEQDNIKPLIKTHSAIQIWTFFSV